MNPDDSLDALRQRTTEPSLRILEALRAEVAASPLPARKGWTRGQRLVLSALWLFLGLLVTCWRALPSRAGDLLASAAAFGLAFGVLLLGSVVPGSSVRLPLALRRWLLAGLALGLLSLLAWVAHAFFLDEATSARGLGHGLACGSHAAWAGLWGTGGLLFLWRGTDPFTPGWTGALMGAIGGLLGALSTGLVCQSREGFHLTVAHGGTLLLLTALAAWLGHKWLQPR